MSTIAEHFSQFASIAAHTGAPRALLRAPAPPKVYTVDPYDDPFWDTLPSTPTPTDVKSTVNNVLSNLGIPSWFSSPSPPAATVTHTTDDRPAHAAAAVVSSPPPAVVHNAAVAETSPTPPPTPVTSPPPHRISSSPPPAVQQQAAATQTTRDPGSLPTSALSGEQPDDLITAPGAQLLIINNLLCN
jgi:hypothetical protein